MAPGKPVKSDYRLWKKVAAGLFLFVFLGVYAVGISGSLHHSIHANAAAPDHKCVFLQVSKGQFIGGERIVSSPSAPAETEVLAASPLELPVVLSPDHLLLPGRAPPVSCV
jgi:hypothetical protein